MRFSAAVAICLFLAPALAQPVTYQGVLDDSGGPADGLYDVRFSLHTTELGGTPTAIETNLAVQVTDGLFTTQIDFPPNTLTTATRWLEIAVRPTGGGAYTPLPRQFMTATPFAAVDLSEPWQRPNSSSISFGDGDDYALVNRTYRLNTNEIFGIRGASTGFQGMNISVDSDDSIPFYGYFIQETPSYFGAYHYYFPAANEWVLYVDGGDVFRVSGDTGNATATGAMEAEAFVFDQPKTHVLTLGPADFHPEEPNDQVQNILGGGEVFMTTTGFGGISAPVHLPQGAIVTSFTAYYTDNSASDMTLRLRRSALTFGSHEDLAAILPSGAVSNLRSTTDSTINLNPIDNTSYFYYARAFSSNWPGNNSLSLRGMVITYTTTEAD